MTGWLSFYLPRLGPIIQIASEQRWPEAPKAGPDILGKRLLYVTQQPQRELHFVKTHFSEVTFEKKIVRRRGNTALDDFYVYSVSGFHGPAAGRVVYDR